MITMEETEEMLGELAHELPEAFYKELSGGIILVPEAKKSPVKGADGLVIMGEYHRNNNLGRYIVIYYGSFMRVHGHLAGEHFKNELRKTLRHEFRHHVESLAGERGLEYEDAKFIKDYLEKKRGLEK
jgi:hypothetical protein